MPKISKFTAVDDAIVAVIKKHKTGAHFVSISNSIPVELTSESSRSHERAVDARLQSLRKAGKVRYVDQKQGWILTSGAPA